jgi:tetratricopeptide (TPR) repeat protein
LADIENGIAILNQTLPTTHVYSFGARNLLAESLLLAGNSEEACNKYQIELVVNKSLHSQNKRLWATLQHGMGECLFTQDKKKEAIPYLTEAIRVMRADPFLINPFAEARFTLARALFYTRGKRDVAIKLITDVVKFYSENLSRNGYREKLNSVIEWKSKTYSSTLR